MKFFDSIINALFPNKCLACTAIIDKEESLCDYCFQNIERVDLSKVCKRCGQIKKHCECKNRVFHFSSVIAPFYNTEVAKQAMYRFKFKKLSYYSKFFSEEMAKAVKTAYYDIQFDGIVYVPMHTVKRLKRGFNQSEVLAKRLSHILSVQLYHEVLLANYSKKNQHKTVLKERFQNVKGMYYFNKKVTGKTILLVDDIKTTGATIDECAKQLLLAGACNVYCVTGLITKPKERNEINGS